MGRKKGVGNGEQFSGTYIKDPWTKPKGVRIEDGKWGWLGWGEDEDNVREQQYK